MKYKIVTVLLIVLLVCVIGFYIFNADFNPKSDEKEILKKLNKIELRLDSIKILKDSIKIEVDTIHTKIINNKIQYEKTINTIINQSSSSDSIFISNYIRLYRSKNDSNNIR